VLLTAAYFEKCESILVVEETRTYYLVSFFFVWVWGFEILHYTGGFGMGFVFGLGCFLVVV